MEDYHECVVSVICRWDLSTFATCGMTDHCKAGVPGAGGLVAASFMCVGVGALPEGPITEGGS